MGYELWDLDASHCNWNDCPVGSIVHAAAAPKRILPICAHTWNTFSVGDVKNTSLIAWWCTGGGAQYYLSSRRAEERSMIYYHLLKKQHRRRGIDLLAIFLPDILVGCVSKQGVAGSVGWWVHRSNGTLPRNVSLQASLATQSLDFEGAISTLQFPSLSSLVNP